MRWILNTHSYSIGAGKARTLSNRLFRSRDESRIRKKTTLLKLSSDTDRSFAAKMMCVLNITSDVGKIFFWNLSLLHKEKYIYAK